MSYADGLVTRWDEILKEGSTISNKKVKRATAIMLENQMNYLTGRAGGINEANIGGVMNGVGNTGVGYSPSDGNANYAGNAEFHKIAIPMVRRTFPELIAHEIVGVQPLTGPVGLAFALRFRADQAYAGTPGQEVGYNTLDPYYTGDPTTGITSNALPGAGAQKVLDGEALGSNAGYTNGGSTPAMTPEGTQRGLGIGTGKQIKELSMTVEKAQVEAGTRKLRSRWSLEVAQDLKAMHGLDLEEEMMDVLAYEITAEIDRELINVMRSVAAGNASSTV